VAQMLHVPDLIGFFSTCKLMIQSQIQSFFQKIESNRDRVLGTVEPPRQHMRIKLSNSD
jgi:hypothetical protein